MNRWINEWTDDSPAIKDPGKGGTEEVSLGAPAENLQPGGAVMTGEIGEVAGSGCVLRARQGFGRHLAGVMFRSYWTRHFEYGFAFPVPSASDKTTIRGLTGCLLHRHGISVLFLVKEPAQTIACPLHLRRIYFRVPTYRECRCANELTPSIVKERQV